MAGARSTRLMATASTRGWEQARPSGPIKGGGFAFKGYIKGDVRKDRIYSLSDTPRRDREGKCWGRRAELGPLKLPLMILMLFIQKADTAAPPGTRGSAPHVLRHRGDEGTVGLQGRMGPGPEAPLGTSG